MVDYGMRVNDCRLGRFFSVDPLTRNYPTLTPYQFAANMPIIAIDLDGIEAWEVQRQWNPTDLEGFRTFAAAELKIIRDNVVKGIVNSSTIYDCADLGVYLIIIPKLNI